MHTAPAVELSGLTKTFRVRRARSGLFGHVGNLVRPRTETVPAITDVSFAIGAGERVAFVGANGAGKSTTLKILSGILRPDTGHAQVVGFVPWRQRRQLSFRLGTVFGQRSQLWYHLPARDTFNLLAAVYEVEPSRHRQRLSFLVEAFDFGPLIDKPVRQLSLGERMRAEIIASLLHQPEILFLDEPSIGLDVSAKALVRALLKQQSQEDGATLLLTSHDTGDIEEVCDRVLVIHGGRLLWDGAVSALRRSYVRTKRITIWSERETLSLALPGVRCIAQSPYRVELELDVAVGSVGALVDAAQRQGALRDLAVEDPPLDDVIRALYAGAPGGTR